MTGEETGLHAFDDLDPISTVSALSALPETDEAPPGRAPVRTTPPEGRLKQPLNKTLGGLPPPRAASGSIPPPAPRRGEASQRGASIPPPPPPSAASNGRELDHSGVTELTDDDAEIDADEDTRIVPNAFAHDPDFAPTAAFARPEGDPSFESLAEPGAETGAAAPIRDAVATPTSIDDAELLELSATTVATNIDMDWDEEEVETKLRDESADDATPPAPLALPQIGGRPSPFPPPPAGAYAGNPSPFGVRTTFPPPSNDQGNWEDEDEAMTKIMNSPLSAPTVPGEFDVGKTGRPNWLAAASKFIDADRLGSNGPVLIGFGLVMVLAFAVIKFALPGHEPSTVTLVTRPADALVLIDGVALKEQTSPFTAQGIKPGEHVLEVKHDGYTPYTTHFELKSGEVKPLDTIELPAQRVDTGFALASLPAGAKVSIDGHKIEPVTPVRITDLASGLHVVRLEYGSAYQPWETQVALATGQVIELPTARLVAAAPAAPVLIGSNHAAEKSSSGDSSASSSSHHHQSVQHAAAAVRSAPAAAPRMSAPVMAAAPSTFGAPAAGGSQGSLRLNSRPWSQVYVDGRMIGNTPQMNVALPAGHHNVKLVNPQLGMSKGFGVDIKAGKVATKIVELE